MKIGAIGFESTLLQALHRSELEVVATAEAGARSLPDAIGCTSDPSAVSSQLQVARNPVVDAIVLAVDPRDRFFLAYEALKAGKHVLIDGPLARTLEEAEFLHSFARSRERVLTAGHRALSSDALGVACSKLNAIEGRLHLLTSRRSWKPSKERETDDLWDRVAHDATAFEMLAAAQPTWVSAVASSLEPSTDLDFLHLTLQYEAPRGSVLGQIELYRSETEQQASISASAGGMRLELRDREVGQIEIRANGEIQALARSAGNPDIGMFRRFAARVNSSKALEDPRRVLSVPRTLDAARRSLSEGGRPVEI